MKTASRNTGAALEEMFKLFTIQKTKNKNPNLLFLLVTGTSSDKAKLAGVGKQFRAAGNMRLNVDDAYDYQ